MQWKEIDSGALAMVCATWIRRRTSHAVGHGILEKGWDGRLIVDAEFLSIMPCKRCDFICLTVDSSAMPGIP